MNKIKFLNKALTASLAIAMVVPISTAFAAPNASSVTEDETEISYTVLADGNFTTNEWEWSIPANTELSDANLSKSGEVAIRPVQDDGSNEKVLVLGDGAFISIMMSSSSFDSQKNCYYLAHNASRIAYKIKNGEIPVTSGSEVLHFAAGTSGNKGIETTMTFSTDMESIKGATLLGKHTDTLTFRAEQG